MAFWTKTNTSMKAGISVSTLDDLLDIALNGKPGEAWGSAYYKGVVKKAASTVRIIPRRYTTLTGVEVDEKDIKAQFGLDINVDNLLYQSSIALNRFGKAYWGLDTKGNRIARARWFNPSTITEDYEPGRGLTGFTRQNNVTEYRKINYTYNPMTELVDIGENGGLGWVWSLGMNETGPGDTLDDDVSLPASLLQWADRMMEMLFKRGGINKWVAFTEHNPNDDDKKRIRASIQRLLGGGVENSSSFEVLSNLLELKQIGTDPQQLGMEEINNGNKADISAAALTPQLIIDPTMASNRSVLDRATSNWLAEFVGPHGKLIADAMNHHVFNQVGLILELHPNGISANQEDVSYQITSWATFVEKGGDPETGAAMLGMDVPKGMPLMLPKPAPPPVIIEQRQPEPMQLEDGDDDEEDDMMKADERRQFKAWYKKRVGQDASKFNALHITETDKAEIIGEVLKADLWAAY